MEILMKDVFICLRPKDMSGHGFSFLEESWRILRLIETNLLSSDKAAWFKLLLYIILLVRVVFIHFLLLFK